MKRLKFYTSVILVLCMLSTMCMPAFAAYSEYSLSWLITPVEGVSGFVYSSTAHGFIIKDWDTYTTALVNDKGAIIPQSEKNFTYVYDNGYIAYDYYTEDGKWKTEVMDITGTDISPDGYDHVYVVWEDRFCCVNVDEYENYTMGITDSAGNVIVPFGKYYNLWWDGLIKAYIDESEEKFDLLDLDGNVILSADETHNVDYLSKPDRYLYYDEATDKSYIRGLDGSDIAVIDGRAYFHPYNFVDVEEYDEATNTLTVYNYDLNGSLVETEVYEDFGGKPYVYRDIYAEKDRYSVEYMDGNNTKCVVDEGGNIVYTCYDKNVYIDIYDNKFIVLCDYDNDDRAVLDMHGNVLVPFGMYEGVSYCEELEIFAFEKDEQIYIAKVTPVTVNVNGTKVNFDQNPVIKDDRTLVPLRAIFEALGADVSWNGQTRTVTSVLGDTTVTLTIGSNILNVNDVEIALDVPAEIISGRTMVPVRAISEAFNCLVGWDGTTRTVSVTK